MKKFWQILKLLLFGWILYIIHLVRLWILYCKRNKSGNSGKVCDCHTVKTPVYKRPDPFIYDQYYLMEQHITGITWDNPDIKIYPKGTTGSPYSPPGAIPLTPDLLAPDTEYVVVARVWNSTLNAAALGVKVTLSYLSFGIGTVSHSIPNPLTVINVGVNGDPHFCPAYAYMRWTTPGTAGHYCLQVLLTCNDDLNPDNNLGQLNTHVVAAQSPANFSFQLRNPDKREHTYHFKSDSYVLPKKDPCKPPGRKGANADNKKAQIEYARARNNVALFPVPPGWTVDINPLENTLSGGEEKTINISITPPATFSGKQPVNINAFTEAEELTGGITLYITK